MRSLKHIFVLILAFSSAAYAQLTSPQIDALAQKALKDFNVAGLAIAVIKDGKVIHEKGYGVRSVATKQPVDQNTNFQIASNSKAFTTAALSILIDEGKLQWKDKVKKYLPEFKLYDEYVTENFLVEDLLCHRSGMGLGAGDLMDFPDGTNFTIQDKLTFAQHFKPVSAFRTQFDYDNQLYFLAGEIIARVSGMTWEQFIQTRILEPLQMTHSYASNAMVTDKVNLAMPHSVENGPMRVIPLYQTAINGAAGGMVSSVHDMGKWVMTQLNKGKNPATGKQLFSEDRQHEMWRIHTVIDDRSEPRYNQRFTGYGLGWGLQDMKGNFMVSHTGGLPGMLTSVTLMPDLNLGIIILTNTENSGGWAFNAINRTIMDSYIKLEDNQWVDKLVKYYQQTKNKGDAVTANVWDVVDANKKTKVDVAKYIGIYEDKWFGKMEVFLKDNQLWIKAHRSPKLNGPMKLYKENTFAIKWEYQDMNCDAFAEFTMDEKGNGQSIKMAGISPNIDFSFDFQDLDLRRVGK